MLFLGFFVSALVWFYGILIKIQDWDGVFEFYLEHICVYVGLAGMLAFGLLGLRNNIKESKHLKEKA